MSDGLFPTMMTKVLDGFILTKRIKLIDNFAFIAYILSFAFSDKVWIRADAFLLVLSIFIKT